ncbi:MULTISPECIES: HNH endonuclease [Pseudomonas]|uniref:HNH endonuclease n=1 Tax=Pseudomonas TaxID=286 RepID=UPI0009BF5CF8|nr:MULTISPECIES: HNH endonuclease [Pseudomonas]
MKSTPQKRAFRTPESIQAETSTREMLKPFLESRGFTDISDVRIGHSQLLSARSPEGRWFRARVRLCWRWEDRKEKYSAAQLRARLSHGDWDKTIVQIVDREGPRGITHALLVQRFGSDIVFAALIPVSAIAGIINEQKKISAELIAAGRLGRLKKNHAVNGGSPTMWLMDDRFEEAHKVADALWKWDGVEDLSKRPLLKNLIERVDDTVNDLPGIDLSLLGRDEASRFLATVSRVARDPNVRKAVIRRCQGRCERPGCGASRPYTGFLDVHHIFGVEVSDRVSNCVALCPNCHRDAHFSIDRETLNQSFSLIAQNHVRDI